jgi:hypothetical protein
MKFSSFFDYQLSKKNKMSLMAQEIGQAFRNSIQKNQLFISNGSRVIIFLMKPCNPPFCEKDDMGQKP